MSLDFPWGVLISWKTAAAKVCCEHTANHTVRSRHLFCFYFVWGWIKINKNKKNKKKTKKVSIVRASTPSLDSCTVTCVIRTTGFDWQHFSSILPLPWRLCWLSKRLYRFSRVVGEYLIYITCLPWFSRPPQKEQNRENHNTSVCTSLSLSLSWSLPTLIKSEEVSRRRSGTFTPPLISWRFQTTRRTASTKQQKHISMHHIYTQPHPPNEGLFSGPPTK